MSRIIYDKYYTPTVLANKCWDKALSVIGMGTITRVLEPSVGGGAFLNHPLMKVDVAYDIAPECKSGDKTEVITADFLTIPDDYVKGQLIIGNPPFGSCSTMARKFFKKATNLGDYIAFILPVSQLHNTQNNYEFDLVYSEDLGIQLYSGRKLHCCFNIYKRPSGGINPKPQSKSNVVSIYRNDTKGFGECKYDFRMCYWGSKAGKVLTDEESYAGEYKIKVQDPRQKEAVMQLLSTYPWANELNSIAQRCIPQYKIQNIINNYIYKQ